jgi:spore germination cell wall hydrolase CwlJ-like protein
MKLTVTKKAITWLTVIALLSTFTLLNLKYDSPKNDDIIEVRISKEELACLTSNIYWESKNQSIAGQIAVAHVTLNRTMEKQFPSTICGVVKHKIGSVCQFSWVCSKVINSKPYDPIIFAKTQEVAKQALLLYKQGHDVTNGALFFHAKYVDPGFFKGLTKIGQIDDHIFYKRKT